MASDRLPLIIFIVVGILSYGYRFIGRDLWVQTGYGNTVQPISDFPYTCRRIDDPDLEACEDMWLSERTRQLYLACSNALARRDWMPNQRDKLIVMDIDKPQGEGFAYRTLGTPGYRGVAGDGKLSLVSVTGFDHGSHIDLYVNNNRPSIDSSTGQLLDNTITGANATIEQFRIHNPKSTGSTAQHMRTFADPQIATPNRVAPTSSGGFFFTNDHGTNRVGIWHHLSPFLKTGDLSYCSASGVCKRIDSGHAFPNGLALNPHDGLLYLPSTGSGTITVYRPQDVINDEFGSAKKTEIIQLRYPIDNLSPDANGDLYVATFPKLLETMPAFDDPLNPRNGPSAVFKVQRRTDGGKGYWISKVLEDRDSEVLPLATTALHDVKTGRIFLSGLISPFITVCDPK